MPLGLDHRLNLSWGFPSWDTSYLRQRPSVLCHQVRLQWRMFCRGMLSTRVQAHRKFGEGPVYLASPISSSAKSYLLVCFPVSYLCSYQLHCTAENLVLNYYHWPFSSNVCVISHKEEKQFWHTLFLFKQVNWDQYYIFFLFTLPKVITDFGVSIFYIKYLCPVTLSTS